MCGVAGMFSIDGRPLSERDRDFVRRMASALAHRGPDGEDYLDDEMACLAFRRLAVIDTDGGRQPFSSEDGEVHAVANGTIYNYHSLTANLEHRHRFETESDCEVLLHLYEDHGVAFPNALYGQFAVALYDRRRGRGVLARDRFGIKPLFYAKLEGRLVFGSEIKALFEHPACPRQVDWPAMLTDATIFGGLSTETEPRPQSGFVGIRHLPPGTVLDIDLKTAAATERTYWRLPGPASGSSLVATEDVAIAYGEALDSVAGEYLVGETEIGLTLSGGVDSSLLAAKMTARRPVRAFSVLSPGTLASGDCVAAHDVARWLRMPIDHVRVPSSSFLDADSWRELLWLCESPLCGPEQWYKRELYRHSREAHPGVKVMVSGTGADEYSGGFTTTLAELADDGGWAGFVEGLRGVLRELQGLEQTPASTWLAATGLRAVRPGPHSSVRLGDGELYDQFVRAKTHDLVMHNLWHEDRLASGSGIEGRAPFLDHRLVEILRAVDPFRYESLLWDKGVIRDVARAALPGWVATRPKGAFFFGPRLDVAYREVWALMVASDCLLVEEAFSGSMARAHVDVAQVRAALRSMEGAFRPEVVEMVLRLVNIGLLDQMAQSAPRRLVSPTIRLGPTQALVVDDWDSDAASRTRAAIDHRPERMADRVLRLGEGIRVYHHLRGAHANGNADTTRAVVAVDGTIAFEVDDESWLSLLLGLDGEKTVRDVCSAAGIDLEDVASSLELAIEYGVVIDNSR
jgi:asparagine synthase (glutamine-hydrolysing)